MARPTTWFVCKTRDESRCAYRVGVKTPGVLGTDFHQCDRKPVETIDGFGFCKQHAKVVQKEKADG
jgi:hypothetical protein